MKVLLTGGTGMLGRAIQRLASTAMDISAPSHAELDLTNRMALRTYLKNHSFDLVIHTAAKVGGIKANIDDMAGFLTENILINTHIIDESFRAGIKNLINFGSSCMYPRDYKSPLREDDILSAPLEPTNEGYAIAKISGAKLCTYLSNQHGVNYKTLIPCNLYGPNDNFDPATSHLLPAAILKTKSAIETNAPTIEIWGDGTARREFVYVDDVAAFSLDITRKLETIPPILNIGAGSDITVNDCYHIIADTLGYTGNFTHNLSDPKGMSHKLMDSSLAEQYGWNPSTDLEVGVRKTFESLK